MIRIALFRQAPSYWGPLQMEYLVLEFYEILYPQGATKWEEIELLLNLEVAH
jgi:hypothetical protein